VEALSADPLAVLLLGPTGSGKTALSLRLAEFFNGEIISCDSVAVYRGMDLGSAKPTPAERTRAPHHLIDVANLDEPYTAGAYSRAARAALQEIAARNSYRPRDPEIAREYENSFAKVELFTVDEVFGGWAKAQQEHFSEGGIFDQIYKN